MTLKFTPQQLEKMLKDNPSLNISSSFGDDIQSTSLITKTTKLSKTKNNNIDTDFIDDESFPQSEVKAKKKSGVEITLENVHNALLSCSMRYEIEPDGKGILLVFDGAKILSRNQTDSLKEKKYLMIKLSQYKKTWFKQVETLLLNMFADDLTNKIKLPSVKGEKLRLYLYRETDKKLYDEDNLVTGFKYLIDGLRQPVKIGGLTFSLIEDDNQDYIKECIAYQVKGKQNLIAVRILIGSNKVNVKSFNDFCNLA